MSTNERALPSLKISLVAVLGVVAILMTGIILLNFDLHMLLIVSICWITLLAKITGNSWREIENAMYGGVNRALPALFIVVLIGMIIGSWIQGGTVPALIYYGLRILTPATFLPAGFIICSVVSTATGTSWSTAGTIGIAMMGIGSSLGVHPAITAGMVISGSYFGDMVSPLSDMTVLSTASAGSKIFTHIRMQIGSAFTAWVISLILYIIIGMRFSGGTIDLGGIEEITNGLSNNFNINIWVLLPAVITLGLSALKVSALPAMFSGVVAGVACSIIFQGATLSSALSTLNYGFYGSTGIEVIDNLLNAGGVQSMMWSFSLAFIALALGGALEDMGFLKTIVNRITPKIKSQASLCATTYFSGLLGNLAMGEAYTTIIISGSLFKSAFAEKNLAKGMLSRCLQQSATIFSPLIPWATGGAFMWSVLGVNPFAYAPYAFVNWITPIVSLVLIYRGIWVYTVEDEAQYESQGTFKKEKSASN